MLYDIVFYVFYSIVVISALFVAFTRNVLYAAFSLILCFLALAGIYVFAGADFIAVTQIIVYVGGVLVLLIFSIMLTHRVQGNRIKTENTYLFWGLLTTIGLASILILGIFSIDFEKLEWLKKPMEVPATFNNIEKIGIALMSNYLLAFEMIGILLLMALVAAAFISKKPIQHKK